MAMPSLMANYTQLTTSVLQPTGRKSTVISHLQLIEIAFIPSKTRTGIPTPTISGTKIPGCFKATASIFSGGNYPFECNYATVPVIKPQDLEADIDQPAPSRVAPEPN
jgi:hypothetical protein